MRISKTAKLILGIGVFIIAVGVLGWVYLEQRGEQQRLDNSLSLAQSTLPTVTSQREGLESRLTEVDTKLAEAELLLDGTKASFPESVESIEYDETIFDIADDCNLKIINLTASEPRDKEDEDITYYITSFEVEVEGTVAHILNFIETIATSDFSPGETSFVNAYIEAVSMSIPEPGEDEQPSANISLAIYGYRGE
ncbi:MAG TPA: hypothetical protein G4N93_01295 [Dehalococcoidia bacterium]|nr:hypothetical protein [Dehalococcoidia bacterium]